MCLEYDTSVKRHYKKAFGATVTSGFHLDMNEKLFIGTLNNSSNLLKHLKIIYYTVNSHYLKLQGYRTECLREQ